MTTFEEYEALAVSRGACRCAGHVLGLRMAMHGLRLLGIDDPHGRDRKRLVTYVEIDRCASDAISLVTGCQLGKRALKFRDFGKMAATFCDLELGRAVRVYAKESSRSLAPDKAGQAEAYRTAPDDVLFSHSWVHVEIPETDLPGKRFGRVVCAQCGEHINFKREVERDGAILCRACAGESYYRPL
ncbi:MAG: FmdE family protein [Bryobacteraceae bacterium]|nr:FmdE family protein [Bryobacteraceae bacterium]